MKTYIDRPFIFNRNVTRISLSRNKNIRPLPKRIIFVTLGEKYLFRLLT